MRSNRIRTLGPPRMERRMRPIAETGMRKAAWTSEAAMPECTPLAIIAIPCVLAPTAQGTTHSRTVSAAATHWSSVCGEGVR